VLHYIAKIIVANVGACTFGDCSQYLMFCYCRKKHERQQTYVNSESLFSVCECVKLCFGHENRVYTLSKTNCENKYYLSHVCLSVCNRPSTRNRGIHRTDVDKVSCLEIFLAFVFTLRVVEKKIAGDSMTTRNFMILCGEWSSYS